MPSIIGVDLGGTKIALARYDSATWDVQEQKSIVTRASEGFPVVMEDMIREIESLRKDDTTGVGVGVPGLLRQPEGHLLNAPNIPHSQDIPVKKILEDRLKLKVSVENDARSFTLAEAVRGAGRGKKVVVGLTLGTGVGGGIVIDGKVFHGDGGSAGEVGHMLLQPGQPPYISEDDRGEVEQFLSGTAMGKRCTAAKSPTDYLNGEVCSFMQPQVYRETAWLCVSLIYLLNPSIIVFGGSAGHALMAHLSEVQAELKHWLLPGTPLPVLAPAELKHAGTLGAALGAA